MADDVTARFWRFSLTLYRKESVPPLCLALQDDHGAEVSVLFWLVYSGLSGRGLVSEALLDAALATISPVATEVLLPLRLVRRRLKNAPDGFETAAVANFRRSVEKLELGAERLIFAALAGLLASPHRYSAARRRLEAEANLCLYINHLTPGGEVAKQLAARLIEAALPVPSNSSK